MAQTCSYMYSLRDACPGGGGALRQAAFMTLAIHKVYAVHGAARAFGNIFAESHWEFSCCELFRRSLPRSARQHSPNSFSQRASQDERRAEMHAASGTTPKVEQPSVAAGVELRRKAERVGGVALSIVMGSGVGEWLLG